LLISDEYLAGLGDGPDLWVDVMCQPRAEIFGQVVYKLGNTYFLVIVDVWLWHELHRFALKEHLEIA